MRGQAGRRVRCAIYTRVSTEHGLDQEFNSLEAQRESCEAYVRSQSQEGWRLSPARYDDGGFSGGTMDRPGLQRLLEQIRSGQIDTVVVYKVDRLTRSLADFAKLVELFDRHEVSFVSVTQSFNTTSSMGRLTLNVLLSFAQFEREVTGERIRDKIAASKKKGMWMGGTVPLGYEVRDRKLVIVQEQAEQVRLIFKRYLDLGSLDLLLKDLRSRGILTKVRRLATGHAVGGIPFTRGPLAYLLRNRVYIGEVAYRGGIHPGEHAPILDRTLFEAVQEKLASQRRRSGASTIRSPALLIGKLFDSRGNRMTPSYAQKGRVRYRYYVSCALHQGRGEQAGCVARVPAPEVERAVLEVLRQRLPEVNEDCALVEHLERALLQADRIDLVLRPKDPGCGSSDPDRSAPWAESSDSDEDETDQFSTRAVISIPWSRPAPPRREVIQPNHGTLEAPRPLRAERRATLVRGMALGRRWLSEIVDGRVSGPDAIAAREGCSKRHVAMMISLAFLSPELVQAALDGSLPHGARLATFVDPPLAWSEQHRQRL